MTFLKTTSKIALVLNLASLVVDLVKKVRKREVEKEESGAANRG